MAISTQWIMDGNWSGVTPIWNTIISPNAIPHPTNEPDDTTTSTSVVIPLLNGSDAMVTPEIKSKRSNFEYNISIASSNTILNYQYGVPTDMTIRAIIQDLIDNHVSVRIRYQEYIGASWVTQDTYTGYFTLGTKTFKNFGRDQRYIYTASLKRFNVDGTSTY